MPERLKDWFLDRIGVLLDLPLIKRLDLAAEQHRIAGISVEKCIDRINRAMSDIQDCPSRTPADERKVRALLREWAHIIHLQGYDKRPL